MTTRTSALALIAGAMAGGSLIFVPTASAQTASQSASENETTSDTIVVTATRRAEAAQSVPISITPIPAETLREAAIRDTQSLQAVAPSLVISVSNSETTGAVVRIRGVGTQGQNAGLEPTVGVFIDGVYIPRSGIALNELVDLERVDVLRGPQGTLFGKNTTAGALVITTEKPQFDFGAQAFVGAGERNGFRAGFSVTGPLVDDKLAVRLSGSANQRDGYVRDVKLGANLNDRDRWSLRGQAIWTPSSDLNVRLIVDRSEKNDTCCAAPYVLNGPRAATITSLGGTVFNPTREADFLVATNVRPDSSVADQGVSLQADWDVGETELRFLVSSRKFESVRDADADFSDLDLNSTLDERSVDETRTAEATVRRRFGQLDALFGVFGYDQDFVQDGATILGADAGRFAAALAARPAIAPLYAAGDGDRSRRFDLSASGWSVFTHNVLALTERLNLTVGARWSSEDKSGGGTFTTRAAAACTSSLVPATLRLICPTRDYRASKSDEHESGVVALSYDVAPNALLFASWSRGFKAGGVSLDRDAGNRSRATFDPETSTSAEIGLKSQWFDRRFTANVTLFDQQYKDFQRTVFTGTETLLSNQGEVNSQGVEVETLARLPARLTLNASITYNLAEYGDNVSDVTLRGRRLNAAPEWTKTLGLAQRVPLSEGLQGYWRLNWRHQTEAITGADLDPLKNQPAYGLLSATIGVVHKPSGTEFSAWGTNLTDEAYRVVTFNSVLQAGSLNAYMGEPRTLGVELRKTF